MKQHAHSGEKGRPFPLGLTDPGGRDRGQQVGGGPLHLPVPGWFPPQE